MMLSTVVNGESLTCEVRDSELLIDFIREGLGLTGVKRSCDIEVCGACTVALDGVSVSACTTLAVEADGKSLTTIEGMAEDGELSDVQSALVDAVGIQCGFCTPGMVMTLEGLMRDLPDATDEQMREYLSGTICRCTGYGRILDVAHQVLRSRRGLGDATL